jgi:inner membrane protein
MEAFEKLIRSPSFKFFLVGFLVFLVAIPLALVWLMSSERQGRAQAVQAEIARDWGRDQRIAGPFIVVPYTVKTKTIDPTLKQQVEVETEKYAVFLPDTLNANATVTTEVRHRSIFDVTVYKSEIELEGVFPALNARPLDQDVGTVRWQDAILSLGVSDVTGVKNAVKLVTGDGKTIPFEPSVGAKLATGAYFPGIHATLGDAAAGTDAGGAFQPGTPLKYRVSLVLNGSSSLKFTPAGRETSVTVRSTWPHPSFTGFLPASRTITSQGFTATWQVPHLARSVPQVWTDDPQRLVLDRFASADLGVNLYIPMDFYSLVDRALKYGFMFIAAVFGGVFVMELLSGARVHPIQYIFVGLAVVIFYVLLLSLSEHVGFLPAYVLASTATGSMVSVYVGTALRSFRKGAAMAAVFAILYGLLYLILQLEDYALLAGALTGFVLLTATMFATLRVNWSEGGPRPYTP